MRGVVAWQPPNEMFELWLLKKKRKKKKRSDLRALPSLVAAVSKKVVSILALFVK